MKHGGCFLGDGVKFLADSIFDLLSLFLDYHHFGRELVYVFGGNVAGHLLEKGRSC